MYWEYFLIHKTAKLFCHGTPTMHVFLCQFPPGPDKNNTGCIRKNCAVGSSVIISDSERLSSPEVYEMKADIRMQKCWIFYENPTETGLAIKGLTWGLQNGACADSLADAHAATLRAYDSPIHVRYESENGPHFRY